MNRPISDPINSASGLPGSADAGGAGLAVGGVRFGYDASGSGPAVLSDVSAVLRPGRVTAILGPNGCGKSTLLRVMLGQLRPWSGSVTLDGTPVAELAGKALARRVSYVPQRGGASFAFSVREVLAMGRFAFGDQRFVDEAIEKCGFASVAGRSFHELSGGQQQRVLIARAWVQSRPPESPPESPPETPAGMGSGRGVGSPTRAVLADEPASSLDLRHAHEAMALLTEMAGEGMAVGVVLHGLDLATRWADEVWLMDRGRMVAVGPADAVLRPEVLSPVYGMTLRRVEHAGQAVIIPDNTPGAAGGGTLKT